MTDIDNYDADADAAVLMTMHAAKGLEFPTVFLPGFEDGIFPGVQTMFNPDEMEEDRRLCYVAITRARENLHILRAQQRMLYGQTTRNPASRFLQDIPQELIQEVDKSTHTAPTYGGFGGSRYGEQRVSYGSAPSRPTSRPIGTKPTVAAKPAAAAGVQWRVGDRVVHASFGTGVITATTPMAGDTLLVIQFDTVGQKKLMQNYARLTKAEN